ncbi:uncharacterized protein A4U43_C01F35710 [Asparagus officinalis]|uniref:PHD-type zinc finger plants domain-containing protein n=1 Tax=Asparagus officinalis TaxID=4686 RepID=A0A5P1FXS0_ASPOF|nr:uncharacterized protein LOC109841944 [Asparagus officinalis]ONK82060.1 uncharacterized protein A4U43_C01F35710 [Asparagus officinalis]
MDEKEAKAQSDGGDGSTACCCICGDVGFSDALLRCPCCRYRLQHTYCSRMYPDRIEIENWACEWCIHKQQQQEGEERTRKKLRPGNGPLGPKNKSSKAADRWRKLARAAKMGSGQRYKLLADVICS